MAILKTLAIYMLILLGVLIVMAGVVQYLGGPNAVLNTFEENENTVSLFRWGAYVVFILAWPFICMWVALPNKKFKMTDEEKVEFERRRKKLLPYVWALIASMLVYEIVVVQQLWIN